MPLLTNRIARRAPIVEPLEGRTLLATTVFQLDPAQSEIAISGNAGGSAFLQQFPLINEGLVTTYAGSLNTDIVPGQITINSGFISAQDSGLYLPGPALGDYGITLEGSGVFVAVRDFALNVTSGATALDGNGNFASGQTFTVTAGQVVADAGALGTTTTPLAGASISNGATAPSTLVTNGTTQTLTIPVDVTYVYNDPSVPVPITINLDGQLVGTFTVPLPEISVLLGGTSLNSGGSVDFGSVQQGGTAPTRSLTVRNDGNLPLALGNVSVPSGFTVVQALPTLPIAVGASATLQLAMDTAAAGSASGVLTIASDDADEAVFTLNLAGTVTTPGGNGGGGGSGVALTGLTVTSVPDRIIGGERRARGQVALQLANQNSTAFRGPLTVTLFASSDATPSPGSDVQLAEVSKTFRFKPSAAAKPLKIRAQFPAVNADGDFFLVASVSGTGVDTAQAAAATAATVRIEKPVVNLVAASSTPTPVTVTLGKRASLAIPLLNQGNVAAKGSVNAELFISPDGSLTGAVSLGTLPARVSVNAGATKSLRLRATLPPAGGGVPTGNFFLLVRLTATTTPLSDLNQSDGEFLPAIPVTIV